MDVIISTEMRFVRDTSSGFVYTATAQSYSFWQRYLSTFDHLRILARIEPSADVRRQTKRADGPGVEFIPLPYYVGPREYCASRNLVRRVLEETINGPEAVILRVPSQIATVASDVLTRSNKPFAVEVVGNPWDSFKSGASDHLLSPFFRFWFTWMLRRQCLRAECTAYVTKHSLQKMFPPAAGRFTTSYSSIELGPEAFAEVARVFRSHVGPTRILTIGSLEQPYKGVDLLIGAVAECVQQGINLTAVVLGDGRLRGKLERLAQTLGVQDRIHFAGSVASGKPVRNYLDSADLFVLASRSEGLPRVILEAMARGLPCIGTRIGGIPELLDSDFLVDPDSSLLARSIVGLIANPERMNAASVRNLTNARDYRESVLQPRRASFYRAICEATRTSAYNLHGITSSEAGA